MALDPEAYAYAIAEKYGINLRGSGQKKLILNTIPMYVQVLMDL